MSGLNDDRNRHLVPRWRSFAAALEFGELEPLNVAATGQFSDAAIADLLEDWRRDRSLSVAADLISGAFTVGRTDAVQDAASFVLTHSNSPGGARRIAQRCVDASDDQPNRAFLLDYGQPSFDELRQRIHRSRARLSEYPFNPVLWTNLALLFATIGQDEKAERAIEVALGLAPDNRFVARAGCRLFLHQGDSERAHSILLRMPSLKNDPWLVAAEVAVASVRKRHSRNIKLARKLAENQNYSPFHLSELTGALATLEADAGNLKSTRKLLKQALEDPAENSLAQAVWLDRQNASLALKPSKSELSNEANAWSAWKSGRWSDAVRFAKLWQIEEPFSSRPAIFGSYAASTALDDFEESKRILANAIRCNRDDPVLLNNLAFALTEQGEVDEAAVALSKAETLSLNQRQMICLTATKGLHAFRSGNPVRGRLHYLEAISVASASGIDDLAWIAQIYFAIEEVRQSPQEASAMLKAGFAAAAHITDPLRQLFRSKLDAVQPQSQNP